MKNKTTFTASVNWEYVNANHRDGQVKPGPWCQRVIAHAKDNGFRGKITQQGACRIINRHL